MASKSPLHQLQENIVGAVKGAITHPVGTAEKAVEQAKGTITLGRAVAGQVAKGAAGAVTSRLPGRQGHAPTVPHPRPSDAGGTTTTERPPLKKAPAKKAPAKKAPAKQEPVKPPVTDVATELVKKQAANQPVPKPVPAPENPIDAAADASHVDATPADVAKRAAKKAPARKAATKAPATKAAKKPAPPKSTPSAKLPARKATPAKPAEPAEPRTAAEVLEDTSVETPVGTTGADVATNPDTTDTDLQQPGTEPLVDPATVKAIASEAATGARAADPDKG